MIRLYAKLFGIGDADVAEAPWLKDWIARHHNSLRRSEYAARWFWMVD